MFNAGHVFHFSRTGYQLDLNLPKIMGVLNVTPDSFSDGGQFNSPDQALERALVMEADGAAIIDIGGESTRPDATPVSVDEELRRVIPVIEAIRKESLIPVSIDTSKPEVMKAAVSAGADIINDVRALQAPGALKIAAQLRVPVCLMHMQGLPDTMQKQPKYYSVVDDIKDFFQQRLAACINAGILRANIMIDPGFGFGKTLEHNLKLLKNLSGFSDFNVPILVGVSRKSMLGMLLDAPVDKRLHGSIALAVLAVWQGASIIRTHDVKETVDAIRVCSAVKGVQIN